MIRKAEDRDLERILEIENICFTSRWTSEMFLYELHENEFGHMYVLEIADKVAGFIDFWTPFECCQLANIAIHPDYQGKGWSRCLLDVMVETAEQEQCETVMLEVRPSNTAARGLYKAYDFIEVNIRKGYYSDNGEDAIVMCKALGGNLV